MDRDFIFRAPNRSKGMDPRLNVRYDSVGDILYVELTPPYRDQESDMIDDYTVARTNPTTGKIESLEILFFLQRARGGESFAVPVGQMFDLVRVS